MNLKPDPSEGEGKRPENPASKGADPAGIPRRTSPVEFDFFAAANDPKRPAARADQPPANPVRLRSTVEPETPRSAAPPVRPAASVPPAAAVPPPSRPAPAPTPAAPAASSAPKPSIPPSTSPRAETAPEARTEPRSMPTPQTMDDFRRNADRQSREQKSFGNVLATITYTILVAFILATALAGYGARVLFLRLNSQGASITEIDKRYDTEVVALKENLKRSDAEVRRLSDDLARQQDQIARLRALADKTTNDLNAERADRAKDEAALRNRIDQLNGVLPSRSR